MRFIDQKTARCFVMSAYVCAITAGLLTFWVSLVAHGRYGYDLFNLSDVAIFFGLAYGVYKRSRVCAIILFTYHLCNLVPHWTHTHSIELTFGGMFIPALVIYSLGILGTFAHHSIRLGK